MRGPKGPTGRGQAIRENGGKNGYNGYWLEGKFHGNGT